MTLNYLSKLTCCGKIFNTFQRIIELLINYVLLSVTKIASITKIYFRLLDQLFIYITTSFRGKYLNTSQPCVLPYKTLLEL